PACCACPCRRQRRGTERRLVGLHELDRADDTGKANARKASAAEVVISAEGLHVFEMEPRHFPACNLAVASCHSFFGTVPEPNTRIVVPSLVTTSTCPMSRPPFSAERMARTMSSCRNGTGGLLRILTPLTLF